MRILNLYAGLGGNRKNWGEDHEVTAVEIDASIASVYAKLYPNDTVIVGDAHQYLLDHGHEFDIVWSSPPCQKHSRMVKATRHKKPSYVDMTLYQEIIYLTHFFKGYFVVENVKPYYTPLIPPSKVLGRHLFWSNFDISNFDMPNHKGFIDGTNTVAASNHLKDWLGIHYEGNLYYKGNHCPGQVLRNCVHPDVGEHVLKCLIEQALKGAGVQTRNH